MTTPPDFRQSLEGAVAALQSQRAALGDALVDAALAPLLERLAELVAQPAPPATPRPAEPARRLRQVSVLFLDIVGSTQLIQHLDPEEVQAVVDGALAAFTLIVTQHGGEVLRYAGDSLKVAFGAHDTAGTREDDAERAVHCGLALLAEAARRGDDIQRVHGHAGFNARVGIHTGGVVRGGGVENDKSLSGLTVNIAARLEQATPAGSLCISQDTWALVRGVFDGEPQPPLQVKGVDAPLNSYRVLSTRERSVATVERGLQALSTPMVGRQAELKRLLQAASQVRETAQLQALTLLGDAGLGKSRLLREFKMALLGATPRSQLLTVRAQPDSPLRPWGLLRSVLAVQCGVADTDSAEVARSKVVDGLSPYFEERGERQAQLIGQLSGLDFSDSPNVKGLDPRTLRDQALAAFRSYLHALATRGDALLVLLVEDLHWCDDSSLDLLQHLLAHAAELPLLLVMTARPALLTRRPDWASPEDLVTLQPLAAAQGDELARSLLQRMAAVPPRLMQAITGQADGNPYYMEELVRRLIDDGVITTDGPHWQLQAERLDTLPLPTTLVGLLQARLDALPAAQRQAARQASVIGHVFWDDALQALDASAPQALPALQHSAYVREHETTDFEGTAERQFDHHLLHQVTYDTLLKAERKLGHGAAARWLAERTQGRGAEFLAMTGEHAERAGDTALAIDCFEQAGADARQRFANSAAMAWLQRAATLLGDSEPKRRFDLLERVGQIADFVGTRPLQDAVYAEMSVLLQRHPDDGCQARLHFCKALLAERRGDRVASQQHVGPAIECAERATEAVAASRSHILQAWLFEKHGDLPSALAHLDRAASWANRVSDGPVRNDLENRARSSSVTVLVSLCRFDEARRIVQQGVSRAEALGSTHAQFEEFARCLHIESFLGQFVKVRALAERMLALAFSMDSVHQAAQAHVYLAEAHESLGDWTDAIQAYQAGLAACRASNDRRKEGLALFGLGRVFFGLGDVATALQWHVQAQSAGDAMPSLYAHENSASAALCRARLGDTAAALAGVNELLGPLHGEWSQAPTDETVQLRWTCQQVLAILEDARAGPMLEQLYADVQARAAEMTDAADRDRLIQALPYWRAIVAAHQRPG